MGISNIAASFSSGLCAEKLETLDMLAVTLLMIKCQTAQQARASYNMSKDIRKNRRL